MYRRARKESRRLQIIGASLYCIAASLRYCRFTWSLWLFPFPGFKTFKHEGMEKNAGLPAGLWVWHSEFFFGAVGISVAWAGCGGGACHMARVKLLEDGFLEDWL
ncbi:hypothetical protein CTAM01_05334 [Colletotrichum tamarilloi]|uniref:Uncharacterized protein n=1 Tax=Colletotrichum tamarilloi TaxID=1209934 RepID=A0ABQ9RFH2_9PEZI|nr:uncharacterized protein CTAM01_05334 [Colletotrichum tamarilloi]KAK1502521.1 hypothetical protein CTAM01_05334 [Colletotrichum tamarilloi]